MAHLPHSSGMMEAVGDAVSTGWGKLQAMFGASLQYRPETSLADSPNIDPRFIPRVPMSNGNLDVHLLSELGRMGMKRGKEITTETHPELHAAWVEMCGRARLNRVPQLILVESQTLNAVSLDRENAVAITTGLLKHLDLREVLAVLGHELAHEVSDHTTPRVAATVALAGAGLWAGSQFGKAGGIGQLFKPVAGPNALQRGLRWLFGDGTKEASPLAAFIYMSTGVTMGTIAANQLTVRPTELDADRKGAMISGDPEGLILALRKLEQEQGENTAYHLFRKVESGYPSIENRIERLRQLAGSVPKPPVADVSGVLSPGLTIHSVSQTERMDVPVPPVAAL